MVLVVKNLAASAGDVRDAGLISESEDHPEKEMATHSSILAWKIPRTEDLGRLQYVGSQRIAHDQSDLACTDNYLKYKQIKCSNQKTDWLNGYRRKICQYML